MEKTVTKAIADCKPGRLLPQHLADLQSSGLRDEIIPVSGVYSENDPERVKELLGGYLSIKTARAMGPCLAFPFFGADGKPMTWLPQDEENGATPRPFIRLKPDKPRAATGSRSNTSPLSKVETESTSCPASATI